jgi:hypothetical protein
MIEIGEVDGKSQIKVNHYTKYSRLNRQEIMGDDNFIKFISSIAYYFDIPNIVIHADFMSCDKLRSKSQKNMHGGSDIEPSEPIVPKTSKKQRTYTKVMDKPNGHSFSKKQTKPDKSSNNQTFDIISEDDDTFTGGSYCLDFYKYLKYNEKRYHSTNTLNVELQPKFSYHDLDLLKHVSPSKILNKYDRDEIYQIYVKNYVLDTTPEKDNMADFYIWMIEHKCYLMDIFIKKMDLLYRGDNPFKKGMYALDAMAYLYNRRYVNTYSRYIKMMIDEEHQLLTLPKNDYRIRR